MIIHSIKLQNIRSYISEVINFSEGSTLLYGDIGSGKTTILLAIEFAIFGILRGSLTGSTLLRYGKSQGSVELNFSIDNKNITIKRFLKRGKTVVQDSGYIIIDGVKTEGTPIELKSIILELLGYPDELLTKNKSLIYRYTVYTPQEEMKTILFEEKEERLNTLRKVFGIDKYKRVQENSAIFLRNTKQKLNVLETKVENIDEVYSLLKSSKEEEQKLTLDLTLIMNKKLELQKEIKSLKSIIEDLETKTSEQKLLKKELELLEKSIRDNKLKIQKQNLSLQELETKMVNLKQEIDSILLAKYSREELEQKERSLQESINHTMLMISSISEVIANLQKEYEKIIIPRIENLENEKLSLLDSISRINKLKDEESKLNFSLEELNNLLGSFQTSIDASKMIIKNIDGVDLCPTCFQKIDKNHRHKIFKKESENIELNERNLKLKLNEKERIKEQIQIIRKELEEINLKKVRLNEIESIMLKINEDLRRKNELEEIINKKRLELKNYENINITEKEEKLKKIKKAIINHKIKEEKLNLYSEYEKNKEKILQTLNDLEEENVKSIERISFIGKRMSEFEDLYKLETYRDHLEEKSLIEKEILVSEAELKKEKEITIKNIREYQNKIDELKIIEREYKRTKNLIDWIENSFLNSVISIEKQVMVTIHKEFNELLAEWLSLLMDDDTITITLNDEFSPIIQQNGYDSYIDNLSGGEKTSLALSYRLALNRVINDFISGIKTKDLIILDEPTDGFSNEQIDRLRDVLEKLNIKQTIIVSHEQKLESYMTNIIKIVKQNHISKII
ncbi:MAG: SMC family ATPase [Candidatus Woesearchaeota archaeon]